MEMQKVIEILYYFGESFILSLACLTFVGIAPKTKRLLLFSISFGSFVIIIRYFLFPALHLPNGYHFFAFIICNVFFLKYIFDLTFLGALICDLLYFITIMIFENVAFLLFVFFGLTPSLIEASPIYFSLYRCFDFFIISVLIYIVIKNKFVLIPIQKIVKMESHGN